MNRRTGLLASFAVLMLVGAVFLKDGNTEDCMRGHDKNDGTIELTQNGQKAFVSHHDIHHGHPMVYLCDE